MGDVRRVARGSTGARGRFAAVIRQDDCLAKPCRAARTDSFGTRTGRGSCRAVKAVTAGHSPSIDHRFGDKHSNVTAWPGRRRDVLWRFEGLAGRVR
jgi:hypothetical protein